MRQSVMETPVSGEEGDIPRGGVLEEVEGEDEKKKMGNTSW
jgi:hypothetical protein